MIKAVFWDNDGVLVDTEHHYFAASAGVLSEVGIELTREAFIEISLRQGRSVLDLALDAGHSPDALEEMRLERNRRYSATLALGVNPISGVVETLESLRGLTMGIVTSSRRDHFDLIHRSSGLLKHFDFILTREDYHLSKPDPEPYLAALKRTGFTPEECLVVEDSERGLQAAVAAGLRCAAIPGELGAGGNYSAAWKILSDIRELPGLIL